MGMFEKTVPLNNSKTYFLKKIKNRQPVRQAERTRGNFIAKSSEVFDEDTIVSNDEKIEPSVGESPISSSPADLVASLATDEEVSAYYGVGLKKKEEKMQERVIQIRRVTKVVKGGKKLSFRAVVVIGDERGQVAVGNASAKEVIVAVAKAVTIAKKELVSVPRTRDRSIPHRIE